NTPPPFAWRQSGPEPSPPCATARRFKAMFPTIKLHPSAADPPPTVADGTVRPAIRPPAAERQIHPEPQLTRLLICKPQRLDKFIGEEREILDPGGRIVERKRINRLHLEAANAAFFHHPHFAFEFGLGHRRPEPPPAHHYLRVIRRAFEAALQLI